jgi:D-threo-aldose 1-dehydrogenase
VRETTLPGTDVFTSAIGLGTAELYRLPCAADRRRILAAALDAGVHHFDTAPMYGLGVAEHELGRFARGRRDRVVLATKFGVATSAVGRALGHVQGPVRRLFNAAPSLRDRARRSAVGPGAGSAGSLLYVDTGYDVPAARRSLETSLRALETDYVDLFMLHEPRPGDVRSADIRAWLEHARDAGMVRAWGVAGEPGPVARVADDLGPSAIRQVREDAFLRSGTPRDTRPRVTFGALGRAMPRLVGLLGTDSRPELRWADLGLDPDDHDGLARLLLRDALAANPAGVLLLGTTDAGHVRSAVEVAAADPCASAPAVGVLTTTLAGAGRRRN